MTQIEGINFYGYTAGLFDTIVDGLDEHWSEYEKVIRQSGGEPSQYDLGYQEALLNVTEQLVSISKKFREKAGTE